MLKLLIGEAVLIRTIKLVFIVERGEQTQVILRTIATTKKIEYSQHLGHGEVKEIIGTLGLTEADIQNYKITGEIVHIKDGSLDIQDLKVAKGNDLKNLKELDKAFKESIQNEPQPKRVKIESQFKRVEGIYKEKEVDNIKTYTKVERDNFETDFIKLSDNNISSAKKRY